MRASVSKRATAAGNSFGASTFRPPAQRSALAVRPAETSFGHDFSQTPVHTTRQPRMLPDFPYAQKLESAFNRNIPGCAVIDEKGCEQRAVPAFTDRTTAHFASPNPPLRVAAHEAVHVLQHSDLTRDAHLGPERHADSVSRLIAKGASVRHLLSSEGAAVEPAIRLYTVIGEESLPGAPPNEGRRETDFRVSDDGRMAVRQDQDSSTKEYWAEPGLIANSNRTLKGKKSVIELQTIASSTLTTYVPGRETKRTLSRVLPRNGSNNSPHHPAAQQAAAERLGVEYNPRDEGDEVAWREKMEIWADCGKCGVDVMGAGSGRGSGEITAKYDVHRPWYSKTPIPRRTTEASAPGHPELMEQEIFNRTLGGTGHEGQEKYEAMSPVEKESFDKKTGINKYAAPGTGEGFSIVRDRLTTANRQSYNYHYAAVVTSSGHDLVTLENLADRQKGPMAINDRWFFQMYGPASKPRQTFHVQNEENSPFLGENPKTLHVAGKR